MHSYDNGQSTKAKRGNWIHILKILRRNGLEKILTEDEIEKIIAIEDGYAVSFLCRVYEALTQKKLNFSVKKSDVDRISGYDYENSILNSIKKKKNEDPASGNSPQKFEENEEENLAETQPLHDKKKKILTLHDQKNIPTINSKDISIKPFEKSITHLRAVKEIKNYRHQAGLSENDLSFSQYDTQNDLAVSNSNNALNTVSGSGSGISGGTGSNSSVPLSHLIPENSLSLINSCISRVLIEGSFSNWSYRFEPYDNFILALNQLYDYSLTSAALLIKNKKNLHQNHNNNDSENFEGDSSEVLDDLLSRCLKEISLSINLISESSLYAPKQYTKISDLLCTILLKIPTSFQTFQSACSTFQSLGYYMNQKDSHTSESLFLHISLPKLFNLILINQNKRIEILKIYNNFFNKKNSYFLYRQLDSLKTSILTVASNSSTSNLGINSSSSSNTAVSSASLISSLNLNERKNILLNSYAALFYLTFIDTSSSSSFDNNSLHDPLIFSLLKEDLYFGLSSPSSKIRASTLIILSSFASSNVEESYNFLPIIHSNYLIENGKKKLSKKFQLNLRTCTLINNIWWEEILFLIIFATKFLLHNPPSSISSASNLSSLTHEERQQYTEISIEILLSIFRNISQLNSSILLWGIYYLVDLISDDCHKEISELFLYLISQLQEEDADFLFIIPSENEEKKKKQVLERKINLLTCINNSYYLYPLSKKINSLDICQYIISFSNHFEKDTKEEDRAEHLEAIHFKLLNLAVKVTIINANLKAKNFNLFDNLKLDNEKDNNNEDNPEDKFILNSTWIDIYSSLSSYIILGLCDVNTTIYSASILSSFINYSSLSHTLIENPKVLSLFYLLYSPTSTTSSSSTEDQLQCQYVFESLLKNCYDLGNKNVKKFIKNFSKDSPNLYSSSLTLQKLYRSFT